MAAIANRRKRILESDSDDDEVSFSEAVDTRLVGVSAHSKKHKIEDDSPKITRVSRVIRPVPLSESSSPEAAEPATKKTKTEDAKTQGNIRSLFPAQAQLPQKPKPPLKAQDAPTTTLAERPRKPTSTEPVVESISDIDDMLGDLSDLDDIDFDDEFEKANSLVGQRATARGNNGANTVQAPFVSSTAPEAKKRLQKFNANSSTQPTSQAIASAFAHPVKRTVVRRKEDPDDDFKPWAERFAPQSLDELAVHKRKVGDVQRWFTDCLMGRTRQRLLILKGHAGTGKTTTVRLLAKEMGFKILEWRNPGAGLFGSEQSATAQFEMFLGVGGTFGSLETDAPEDVEMAVNPVFNPEDDSKRVILIEEFPNTFQRSSSALMSFRSTVLGYLDANTPSLGAWSEGRVKEPIVPMVMVISETLLTTTSASADSFTAHRLLGPDILKHMGTAVIEFNAIAPSILTKALEQVVVKEARKSGRRRTPGPQVLKKLGEIGDIRNAISSLEFMCLKGDLDGQFGATVNLGKSKRSKKDVSLTKSELETLEQVSQREATLGIFHAVGKVVYNKRDDTRLKDNPAEDLPDFLSRHSRPKRSQVDVETLIDEIGTDTATFVSALHENYPLSCESPLVVEGAPTAVDYLNGCLESLSDSDMLCPSWDVFFGGKGGNSAGLNRDSGSYVLRQDEMSFQVAVRGMLHSLPVPVKRQQHPGRGGGDAFKMFYPTSIKLWKTKEEIEGLLTLWSGKLLYGDSMASRQTSAGSSMFSSRNGPGMTSTRSHMPQQPMSISPLPTLGHTSRWPLLLDRLPALATIMRGQNPRHPYLPDLERIVTFRGIGTRSDDDATGEGDDAKEGEAGSEQWATDRPTEEKTRKVRVGIQETKGDSILDSVSRGVGGLRFGDGDDLDVEIEDDVED